MIIVYNGENIDSTATEDEVLLMDFDESGKAVPAKNVTATFDMVSGTVQVTRGKSVNTSKATSHSTTVQNKWIMTLNCDTSEGGPNNLRVVGVGVVAVTW